VGSTSGMMWGNTANRTAGLAPTPHARSFSWLTAENEKNLHKDKHIIDSLIHSFFPKAHNVSANYDNQRQRLRQLQGRKRLRRGEIHNHATKIPVWLPVGLRAPECGVAPWQFLRPCCLQRRPQQAILGQRPLLDSRHKQTLIGDRKVTRRSDTAVWLNCTVKSDFRAHDIVNVMCS